MKGILHGSLVHNIFEDVMIMFYNTIFFTQTIFIADNICSRSKKSSSREIMPFTMHIARDDPTYKYTQRNIR